jgi:hypothetical protein
MIEVKDITDILGRNVMEFISPESREEVLITTFRSEQFDRTN